MADSGAITQAQALELLRRTSDAGWLGQELSGPDGTAVISARTSIAEATSQSIMSQAAACTISEAPGPAPGICTLTLARDDGSLSDITIPAGYPFRTADGIDLIVSTAVITLAGQLTFDVRLETVRRTELVNTYVPAFDSLQEPGTHMQAGPAAYNVFDSIDNVVLGPDADYPLLYSKSTAITGATSDWIGAHGDERGQRRQAGETTEEYRARIRLFPDAVSPVAISTAIHGAANNAGLPDVVFVETINPGVSDAMAAAYSLGFQDTVFESDYCDDAVGVALAGKVPSRSLEMVSAREGRAYFRLVMTGQLQEEDGAVLYLDDGYLDDANWGFPDLDMQVRMKGALMTIHATANQLRAAGVQFDLYVENAEMVPSTGCAVGASWDLTPENGKAWLLLDGLVSHSPWIPGKRWRIQSAGRWVRSR